MYILKVGCEAVDDDKAVVGKLKIFGFPRKTICRYSRIPLKLFATDSRFVLKI